MRNTIKTVVELPPPKPKLLKPGRPEVYPFSTLEVGESFMIKRTENANPSYEAARMNLYRRNRTGKKVFHFQPSKFPNLIIKRIK